MDESQAFLTVKDDPQVEAELKKWDGSAFLLTWIWGIGNRTYISLFALIPFVNLVMMFVLGVKGNRWAWENKVWKDLDHFREVQKKWAFWSCVIVLATLVFYGFLFFYGIAEIK